MTAQVHFCVLERGPNRGLNNTGSSIVQPLSNHRFLRYFVGTVFLKNINIYIYIYIYAFENQVKMADGMDF